MSFLVKSISSLTRNFLRTSTERYHTFGQIRQTTKSLSGHILNAFRRSILIESQGMNDQQVRTRVSLQQIHKRGGLIIPNRRKLNPLGHETPFAKGVVLKTLIKKPKKPNSANRKCVLVRLSSGKEMVAYVPGEGHNLQEHNIVLCRVGRLKDVPGVKIKCVRGKYDLPHVVKKK